MQDTASYHEGERKEQSHQKPKSSCTIKYTSITDNADYVKCKSVVKMAKMHYNISINIIRTRISQTALTIYSATFAALRAMFPPRWAGAISLKNIVS